MPEAFRLNEVKVTGAVPNNGESTNAALGDVVEASSVGTTEKLHITACFNNNTFGRYRGKSCSKSEISLEFQGNRVNTLLPCYTITDFAMDLVA